MDTKDIVTTLLEDQPGQAIENKNRTVHLIDKEAEEIIAYRRNMTLGLYLGVGVSLGVRALCLSLSECCYLSFIETSPRATTRSRCGGVCQSALRH